MYLRKNTRNSFSISKAFYKNLKKLNSCSVYFKVFDSISILNSQYLELLDSELEKMLFVPLNYFTQGIFGKLNFSHKSNPWYVC